MPRPKSIEHGIDHLIASVRGEVDIDIGVRLTTLIEEALKDQVVPNRVDARNAEQIGDHRITGAAATLRRNAVAMRAAHDVGAEQKEFGEPRALNRRKLAHNASRQLVTTVGVATGHPRPNLSCQLLVGTHACRKIDARESHARKVEMQIGALRNLTCARNRRSPRWLHRQHLNTRSQMRVGGRKAQRAESLNGNTVPNGSDGVEQFAFGRHSTARRGTRQQRQPTRVGEVNGFGEQPGTARKLLINKL